MSETEICENCEYILENLALEDKVKELEGRIEALELFVESLKQILLEKMGYLNAS